MFDLGAHRGFSTIGLLIRIAERPVLVGALVGEVLGLGRKLLESLALLLAPVGAIAIQPRLLADAAGWATRGCRARYPRSRWRCVPSRSDCPPRCAASCQSTTGYLFCFDASPGRGFARGSSSTVVPRSVWRRRWCPRRASCHWSAAALPPWQTAPRPTGAFPTGGES